MNALQNISERDRRILRFATIGIAVYLALFFALTGWKKIERRRAAYAEMLASAKKVKQEVLTAENKVLLTRKLEESFALNLAKLSKSSALTAQASAAIQTAARNGGLQLGPVRESAARPATKELTSIQLEGMGPVPAVLTFINGLETLGYPIIIDSVQITPFNQPGMLKVSVSLTLLDFEAWKGQEVPRA